LGVNHFFKVLGVNHIFLCCQSNPLGLQNFWVSTIFFVCCQSNPFF
jgi:hypothetical protein